MSETTSQRTSNEPGLYGINTGNSNRANADMWGKNCFNSAFPTALACYMRDNGHQAVYVRTAAFDGGNIKVENAEIGIDEVFNSTAPNHQLRFAFEEKFAPLHQYNHVGNELDGADLVVMDEAGNPLRQFQVKLTVTPDNTTSAESPDLWAPEIVFRPADTSLCALGMFHNIVSNMNDGAAQIKNLFDELCYGLTWESLPDNEDKKRKMTDKAIEFIRLFRQHEQPYLLQPIWKTEGKSPWLDATNALDIFVWSDFALIAACIIKGGRERDATTRGFRAIARFVRAMHDLSVRGNTRLRDIYRKMDFNHQTDKEMALSGKDSRRYLTSDRRANPLLPPDVIASIILNNGHLHLSPERRFDQTIFFTADKLFQPQSR